ncbi:MAG: alcohol dehydrogenase catalytic domain-containing protein, partial [Eubacteriales bacterium]
MNRIVLRVTAPKKIEVFTEPLGEPGPHEMVIRISIAGICRSDMPVFLGEGTMQPKGPLGFPTITSTIPYPAAFGHEATGTVERVGAEVTRFAPGDRVSGACGGAFASHIVVSEFAPFAKLPDSVPNNSCLAEPVMCSVGIARDAMPPLGGSVAVVGCGYMGLLAISLLHAKGVKNISAFNRNPDRLAMAKECGAAHTFETADDSAIPTALKTTGGAGFDRAIELTGSLDGLLTAAHLIKRPGVDDRGIIA